MPLTSIGRLERAAGEHRYALRGLGIGTILDATVGAIQFANSYSPCDYFCSGFGAFEGAVLGAGIGFGVGYFASLDRWVDVGRDSQKRVSLEAGRNGVALRANIRF